MSRLVFMSTLTIGASLGAMLVAGTAHAAATAAAADPAGAAAEAAPGADIVVTGTIVAGEMKSIAQQRRADNIVNVLSSDGIGRLPDRNAAEAVQRLPGVAIERDQGEGRFVAVRGLPSQWNSTLINGDRLPTAEEETTSRATAFDFFPSELIDQVVVSKAVTPDMEGDAIGGSVNFITKTAPDKRTLQLTGGVNYGEKSGKAGFLASGVYGDRIGRFGFVLSGTYYKRQWATDNYEPRRGGDGVGITRLELRDYTGVRETTGINAAMQYDLDDGGKIYARGIYGSLNDDETHYKHRYRFDKDRIEQQSIFNTLITELSGGELGGEHMLGGLLGEGAKFDWKVSHYENLFRYGNTPDKQDHSYFVVRFDQNDVGYQGLEDRGSGDYAYNTVDGGTDPADAISNHLPSDFAMDPARMPLANVELYKIRVKETDRIVLQGNLTVPAGDTLTFKLGGKYRDKKREASFEDLFYTWNPAAGPVPTLSQFPLMNQPTRKDYLDELAIGSAYARQFGQVASEKDLVAWYLANRGNLVLDEGESATMENGGALGRTFTLHEKQAAGYAMGTWNPTPDFTLVGGVRLEYTKTTVDGHVLINDALEPTRSSNDYLSVLPSLNATYRMGDTQVRAAVTRTFARPDFGDLAPGGAFSEADLEYQGGNPDLKPTYSWNGDLMVEHYFGNDGVISAGAFYKRISNPIYDTRRVGTYRGIDGVTFLTPGNGATGDLYGFEFNVQRRLSFLPGLLSNLGVNANYTLIRSRFTLPDGREVKVPRQADNLANVAVYYDDGRFSTRLAMNYKGAYIEEYGSDADSDSYYGAYTSLDLTMNWQVTDSVTLFGEASNLTDQKLHYYLGNDRRPLQVEYYGPRFMLGVKAAIF